MAIKLNRDIFDEVEKNPTFKEFVGNALSHFLNVEPSNHQVYEVPEGTSAQSIRTTFGFPNRALRISFQSGSPPRLSNLRTLRTVQIADQQPRDDRIAGLLL